jgi:autotransporter-associated beta strand protein
MAGALTALLGTSSLVPAQQQRSLGIDVSDYQGSISVANWATLKRATNVQVGGIYGDGRDFVFIRASRGGTTGVYNENDPNNTSPGTNTLSQRYDDPDFVQNITRATTNGLFAGPYHFARPDIVATNKNSGGIANTGTDEANHMIQMAGAWMRPGYLPPVCDLEVGQSQHSIADLTAWCTSFSAQIYAMTGIHPMMYVNGNYANSVQSPIVSYFPNLWSARWPTTVNPQTNNPSDSYAPIYGPWDDPPYPAQPWEFWQYADNGSIHAISGSVDLDVAQGGLEFVKDYLIPALWVTSADGAWINLSNWNSGQTPVAPPYYAGQPTPVGTQTLPSPSLPGTNDTVILDVPGTNVTITLPSGTQNIRKLYVREKLNITGGALNINYVPSWDSTPIAAEFSDSVTLGGGASLSVYALQVDATNTFTLSGGTLAFNTINLMPDAVSPAKIAMSGDVSFNALTNATATITNGAASGMTGLIDLGSATRAFNVTNNVSLSVYVPITDGALAKTGPGTMFLGVTNAYSGATTITSGTLALINSGAINTSSQLSLAAGATFDVSALASPYSLSGNTSLSASGTGTAAGSTAATIRGGTTVSLGSQPISLTFKPAAFSGDSNHPALYISQGALSLNGNAFSVSNASGTALGSGTYLLIQQANGNVASFGSYPVTVTGSGLAANDTASIQVSGGNVNLLVNAPVPPVIQTAMQSRGSFLFTWSSLTNQIYRIQSTPSLAPANWTNLGSPITATNSATSISEPVDANTQQFYRVVLLP